MNLNPFYHLRKYRQQSQEIARLNQFNNLVLNRNSELNQDLTNERQALDQANANITNLENELEEIQSEFLILVNAKTLSRKQARALKNKRGANCE